MKINEFRFLTVDDKYNESFVNWSRCYEWHYVLDKLSADPDISTIHNSCCGPGEIHKQFADMLNNIPGKLILHTDMNVPSVDINPFRRWEMSTQFDETHDCVLCISTLEELKAKPAMMIDALNNLFAAADKRLIVTFDYPDVPLELIEEWVGMKCKTDGTILNGSNSFYRNDAHKHLSVVVLDISK